MDWPKSIKRSNKPIPPIPAAVWKNPLYFIAFGCGSGAIPFAPGTFATLAAIPFYLLMRPLPLLSYIMLVIVFCIFSAWVSDKISIETQTHDHPGLCIDEFAGFFVTMTYAPSGWQWVLLGFILFRFFDIYKPWPICLIDETVHGGVGMVLDDVIAGFASCLIIQIARLTLI
jgi:phosphatidylglycerophosphatase A